MGLLDFIEWAARTGNPVRDNESGALFVWHNSTGPDDPNGPDGFIEIDNWGLSALYLGEIGEVNVSVRDSVTILQQKLTASGPSTLDFEIIDPNFGMYKKDTFVLDRTVNFNGWIYRINSVTAHHQGTNIVKVQAQPQGVYALKNDKGAANFGAISPTAFAAQKAAEFGMTFFGEASAAGEAIIRKFDDDNDESTWDVLARLAREEEFSLFESNNQLWFSSEEFIVNEQPVVQIAVPSTEGDTLFVLSCNAKEDSDSDFSALIDFKLIRNALSANLFPGVVIQTVGLGKIDSYVFMITAVHFDVDKGGTVSVSARSTDEPVEIICRRLTLQLGDEGACVKRIQKGLGFGEGGLTGLFGPYTEQKVKDFQALFDLEVTGIITPKEWALIEFIT
jgi:hypothetical protein